VRDCIEQWLPKPGRQDLAIFSRERFEFAYCQIGCNPRHDAGYGRSQRLRRRLSLHADPPLSYQPVQFILCNAYRVSNEHRPLIPARSFDLRPLLGGKPHSHWHMRAIQIQNSYNSFWRFSCRTACLRCAERSEKALLTGAQAHGGKAELQHGTDVEFTTLPIAPFADTVARQSQCRSQAAHSSRRSYDHCTHEGAERPPVTNRKPGARCSFHGVSPVQSWSTTANHNLTGHTARARYARESGRH
jgi:hypothetical protein